MNGAERIAAERTRQTDRAAEGWDDQHDDSEHRPGDLALAAMCYVKSALGVPDADKNWPWPQEWWKPKTFDRDLERAGALIAAELDRMDRDEYKEYEGAYLSSGKWALSPRVTST